MILCQDCVGAIDGTHIRVKVSAKDAPRYRGRKDYPTQNVLAACTFDLKFTYVLAGWEGSASDSRIIKNALTREDKLKIPQGKYYLVDVGFMLTSGLITPYRGVQYHLKEYSAKNPPQNYKELFNLRHASLRNAIERAFGVLKKRFEIIYNSTEPNSGVKAQKLIIFACCILHNYLMSADPDEDLIAEVDAELANQTVSQENYQASTSDRDEVALGGLMASKKQLSTNNGNSRTLSWTRAMDDALVDDFMHEFENGGMSGFSMNPTTQLWDAEPEVWDALIASKQKAAYWRNVPLPNYEKMVTLYGPNRADGDESGTLKETRKQSSSVIDEDFVETIHDIDGHVARNEVNLEGFDTPHFDFTVPETQSSDPSPIASGSKKKKLKVAKNKESNNEMIEMKESMNMVAEALREGNEIMRERQKYDLPPISGEES
ncbi:unnamed protein product [Trifolium pratense]|uniref:Uncharacterized protein n=1 Tax=Trifolium pratense TaxID=57577 RepID=A0ACB0K2N2_TRIPR|nr:unnamed protein product [Trifolium pratense]